MAWLRKAAPRLVGIDISTSAIKVLELAKRDDRYSVEAYGVAPLPVGAFSDREIHDVAAVTEAVKLAVERSNTSAKRAAIALRSSNVIAKVIQMNADLADDELEQQVKIEAARYIPYSIDEVSLDFEVLPRHSSASDRESSQLDVLIAACRREHMESFVDIVDEAGLQVSVVDVQPYAMERACQLLKKDLPSQGKDQTVLLVDVGAEMTTLTVLHDLETVYMREEEFGGARLTKSIQERYGLSYDEAGKAKKMGHFKDSYEREILAPFRDALVTLIRRSLQFFYSATPYDRVDHIILAGGTANINGLATTIHHQFNCSVALANPFSRMHIVSTVNEKNLLADASALMVPCGLALRNFES